MFFNCSTGICMYNPYTMKKKTSTRSEETNKEKKTFKTNILELNCRLEMECNYFVVISSYRYVWLRCLDTL